MKKLTVTYLVALGMLVSGYLLSANHVQARFIDPASLSESQTSGLVTPLSDTTLEHFQNAPSAGVPQFPILQIEGLQFDTPLPLTPKSQSPEQTFTMLSSLTFAPLQPLVVSTKEVSSSFAEAVIPEVQASEATPSGLNEGLRITEPEATDSGQPIESILLDPLPALATAEATIAQKKTTVSKKVAIKTTTTDKTVKTETATEVKGASISPTPIPTTTPTPSVQPKPSDKPIQLSNGGLNADTLFEMSNNYRKEHGLVPFEKDSRSCELAASRAPEIGEEIANGHMHSGLRARKLPYWNSENIISMRSEHAAFNWWINDKIHHDQIVADYKFSCVACSGNSCAQEFTNFIPK